MAKTSAPATGRQIDVGFQKPKHLATKAGPGRTRQSTEFDEMVPEWYQFALDNPDNPYVHILAEGDTDEEKLEDLDNVYKAVQRAVAFHDLGVSRLKEDDPADPNFAGYGLWIHVRDRQQRPRKNKEETATDDDQNEYGDGIDSE